MLARIASDICHLNYIGNNEDDVDDGLVLLFFLPEESGWPSRVQDSSGRGLPDTLPSKKASPP